MSDISFPRQQARTRRFSLGVPRDFEISPDGGRVVFLRTRSGTDRRTCLWQFDVHAGTSTVIADPATLTLDEDGEVPAEERMRRERARESSGGIVRFSTNIDVTRAAFDLAGKIYVIDLVAGGAAELPANGRAIDPRIDPTGTRVAYVEAGALHVVRIDGDGTRVLLRPENDQVTYGLAEFVAAEEMGRQRGYWWSPDGSHLLVARVDVARVRRWYISDPSNPATPPVSVAYPAAGTDNADVTLHLVDVDGSPTVDVRWDRAGFEYVTTVDWSEHGLLVVVQSRDQRTMRILEVDASTGETSLFREDTDDAWVDIVDGVPERLPDGTLVWTVDRDGAKRLVIGDEMVTGVDLEVRDVVDVDGDVVVFRASANSDRDRRVHVVTRRRRRGGETPGRRSRRLASAPIRRHHGDRIPRARTSRRACLGPPRQPSGRRHQVVRGDPGDQAQRPPGDCRQTQPPRRRRAAVWVRIGEWKAAGAARPVRRTRHAEGGCVSEHVPGVAVVRGPGVRGARHRWQGDARTWTRVGAVNPRRPGRPRARGSG